MRTLDLKVWRELWAMRGQALAIAAVILSGVATMVMFRATYDSLLLTRDSYYTEHRFAEVFANLKRAPESLAVRIREIPGVDRVETRVVAAVNLEIEGFDEPVVGKLVSVPDTSEPLLNTLWLREGRMPVAGRDAEAVIASTFADAHDFEPGDSLYAIVNGRRKSLVIVGIAQSPEYIYQIAPGALFPDFKRYGVLWMARTPLSTAYGMDGAFNDVSLSVARGVHAQDVIDRLDDLLRPWGGRGAYERELQFSNRFLSEELRQLQTSSSVFPLIFIGVSAFLLNVVIGRLINTQRNQIAILKAFGYGNLAVGAHYLKLVVLITLLGIVAGTLLGIYWGRGLARVYMEFYSFPFLDFILRPAVVVQSAAVTLAAAVIGTLHAVWRAVRLPPAEALRPESPMLYRESWLERAGLRRLLSQPSRMVLRHIGRRPVKSMLSMVGIALACGIMMVGNFQEGAVRFMVEVQFSMSHRDDLTVNFLEPTARRAMHEMAAMQGVEAVQGFRSVPVRLRYGHRSYRTSLEGVESGGDLMRVLGTDLRPIDLPGDGVILTDHLAKILGVRPGDTLIAEVLEGSQPVREVRVAGLTRQYLGVWGYMDIDVLNRMMREGSALSGLYLRIDQAMEGAVFAVLREVPRIAGTIVRRTAIQSFYDTMAETILFFSFIANLLGAVIAFGVVYNTARIALSERGRELASLRVLGFSHGEISWILLGELAVLTVVAVPLGFLVGYGLCWYLASQFQTDLYRIPLVMEPSTFATAATVVMLSAMASGWIVWRQLGRLDLVAVLKTQE